MVWIALLFIILDFSFCPTKIFARKNELVITSPITGELIHGFQLVRVSIKGNLTLKARSILSLINSHGKKSDYVLVSDQHQQYVNIDTRELPDGTYFLYVRAFEDQNLLSDSEVISVIVDNRSHNLDVQVHPTLTRSGSEIEFTLKASLIIKKAYVEMENGVRIYLNNTSNENRWVGKYFIPYLWNEGTHFISFEAEDSSGKRLKTSASFIICNSEPYIVFPKDGMQVMNQKISLKGFFAAGKPVYLDHNGEIYGETITSNDGQWIFKDVALKDNHNVFRVFADRDNRQNPLFPYQQIQVKLKENSLTILTYHNISPGGNIYSRSAELFENDLQYLFENNFNLVSPALLVSYFDGKAQLPPNPVLICFDDGYLGVYEEAFPVLKKHNVSALFFVLTSRVGVFKDFVTWEQLSEMQSSRVFSIESHTHNSHFYVSESDGFHAALTSRIPLPDGTLESHQAYRMRIKQDLLKSKQLIESNINKEALFLSVPFGNANNEVNDIALSLGFKATFNSDGGLNELPLNPLNIKRITVKRDDRIEDIVY